MKTDGPEQAKSWTCRRVHTGGECSNVNSDGAAKCQKCGMPRYSAEYSRWNPEWQRNRCSIQAIEPVSMWHGTRTVGDSHVSWGDHEPGLKVRLEVPGGQNVNGFVCKRCHQVVVVPDA